VVKGELGIHEGMISISEADISLRYLVQVRAKVMAAYNEIIKMPI
jgi:flagellar hook-basal body complex protein FliE